MAETMRFIAMAIAASHRLGWIALGLYIQRINLPAEKNPFYEKLIDYHRAMGNEYHFFESAMKWADDFRMVMFNELALRVDAIEDNWGPFQIKQQQKSLLMRRAQQTQLELEGAWIN
jgi:hypothetical protein